MKKIFSCLLVILLIAAFLPVTYAKNDELVLRVYNCQDYIDDGTDEDGMKVSNSIMEDWEADYFARTGKKVTLIYDTYETNETMLNTLKTGKTQYDLVCPSDYAIQKMILATENGSDDKISLEKFDLDALDKALDGKAENNIRASVSPFIQKVFRDNGFSDYSVGYMWGTVGIIYDPEVIPDDVASSWMLYVNPEYKNLGTLKDSVRDTYIPAVAVGCQEEVRSVMAAYDAGTISAEEYHRQLADLFNRTDDETLSAAGNALAEMKQYIHGLEVDNGKSDIVVGKIKYNLAWSGDAVYALDLAEEEEGLILKYVVPEDGVSVWFDGWVMPKGANTELAMDFVNYLCAPENAARNMDYTGYTSVIAGKEIYDLVKDWYHEEDGTYARDLTYFFEGTVPEEYYDENKRLIVRTSDKDRQLFTQYPDLETVDRAFIMRDFGDRNEAMLAMWAHFKANTIPVWVIILISVLVLAALVLCLLLATKRKRDSARRKRQMKKG